MQDQSGIRVADLGDSGVKGRARSLLQEKLAAAGAAMSFIQNCESPTPGSLANAVHSLERAARIVGVPGARRFLRSSEKRSTKCALPGCEQLTAHNGGYCSAAHCKEHASYKKASEKA